MKTFNPHNTKKLTSFLEQSSSVPTLKNGDIISENYDKENPETWDGIIWNDNGECFVINWYGKKHLAGNINLNDCKGLSFLFLDNNNISSLSTSDCSELEELTCNHNKISELDTSGCYNLYTLKITGNPLKEITLIACDKLRRKGMIVPGQADSDPSYISDEIQSSKGSALSQPSDPLIQFLIKSENYALSSREYFKQRQQLKDRKSELDHHFPFTPEQVAKIEEINTWLDKKYRGAIKQAQYLETIALEQIKDDTFINDYEIDFVVDIYSSEKYSHISDMDGIPVYSGHPTMGFMKKAFHKQAELNWFLEENHNEFRFRSEHPLKHQHHCWLLHELYDHTYLAWVDILDVEEIWVDVVLVTQSCGVI